MNLRAVLAAALLLGLGPVLHAADKPPVDAGPYVPSPSSVVSDMLTLAAVGPKDFVIDLGSGDGRIVLTAAKVFGARGFGVDINAKLVKEANEAAKLQGVADRASFTVQDLFKTDISKATVVTMYLLPTTVVLLKDKLLNELRPGTRILSHDYPLAGWRPEQVKEFELEDKVPITGVTRTIIFMYLVPARIEGTWIAKVPANVSKEPLNLTIATDRVIRVTGTTRISGRNLVIEDGLLRGERLEFFLNTGAQRYEFSGTVNAGSIEGIVQGGGIKAPWSAARAK